MCIDISYHISLNNIWWAEENIGWQNQFTLGASGWGGVKDVGASG